MVAHVIPNFRRRPKYLLVVLFEGVLAAFMREQNQVSAQADYYDEVEEDGDVFVVFVPFFLRDVFRVFRLYVIVLKRN